jgi:hypothetical protein
MMQTQIVVYIRQHTQGPIIKHTTQQNNSDVYRYIEERGKKRCNNKQHRGNKVVLCMAPKKGQTFGYTQKRMRAIHKSLYVYCIIPLQHTPSIAYVETRTPPLE